MDNENEGEGLRLVWLKGDCGWWCLDGGRGNPIISLAGVDDWVELPAALMVEGGLIIDLWLEVVVRQ